MTDFVRHLWCASCGHAEEVHKPGSGCLAEHCKCDGFYQPLPLDGKELQLWRLQKGWTQQQAAEWYGVNVRTWRRYELQGDRPIPRRLWLRLKESQTIKVNQP